MSNKELSVQCDPPMPDGWYAEVTRGQQVRIRLDAKSIGDSGWRSTVFVPDLNAQVRRIDLSAKQEDGR